MPFSTFQLRQLHVGRRKSESISYNISRRALDEGISSSSTLVWVQCRMHISIERTYFKMEIRERDNYLNSSSVGGYKVIIRSMLLCLYVFVVVFPFFTDLFSCRFYIRYIRYICAAVLRSIVCSKCRVTSRAKNCLLIFHLLVSHISLLSSCILYKPCIRNSFPTQMLFISNIIRLVHSSVGFQH